MSETFFVNFWTEYAETGIELGLANVLDNFTFSFVFSIKNEGVIEVFSKITLKTSRDRSASHEGVCCTMLCAYSL